MRNTLALAVVPEAQRRSGLPVLVDPSHGTGKAHLVAPMCRAALACGADGLLIEVHPGPGSRLERRRASAGSQGVQRADVRLQKPAAACDREL